MKIAYCLNSISRVGGIETAIVTKANALSRMAGYEVFILVTDHEAGAGAAAMLSESVSLINLEINYYEDDWKSKWHVLKGFFVKRRVHKRRLTELLNIIAPDVVVSVGQSEKYMLPEIKGDWVSVREMHYHKGFRRQAAASRSTFYKIAARVSDFYDYRCKIGKYDSVVVLTNDDLHDNWRNRKNFSVIPNLATFSDIGKQSSLNSKRVIAAGRLAAEKNFSSLIRAFRMVADRHPDWILEIYGDGCERAALQQLTDSLNLTENVYLRGETAHIQEKLLDASVFVLSSAFEGFGLVIIEAMSCGLPVVSYDCPCGPKNIITDGVDGFLVPTGDEQMLAEKMCCLIENPDKRAEMGAAALVKSENYGMDKIIPMWQQLFETILNRKKD